MGGVHELEGVGRSAEDGIGGEVAGGLFVLGVVEGRVVAELVGVEVSGTRIVWIHNKMIINIECNYHDYFIRRNRRTKTAGFSYGPTTTPASPRCSALFAGVEGATFWRGVVRTRPTR